MELFRVPIIDMAFVAAINRRTFDVDEDFVRIGAQIGLTASVAQAIEVIERANECADAVVYSLEYAGSSTRVRLLEKMVRRARTLRPVPIR